MPYDYVKEQAKTNQNAIEVLQSIVKSAVTLQEMGEFTVHDLDDLLEVDQVLDEIWGKYETQE